MLPIAGLVSLTTRQHFLAMRMSETHISRLEVDQQKLEVEKTSMERFLHMTSHDMRTPVQAIMNATQLMSQAQAEAQFQRAQAQAAAGSSSPGGPEQGGEDVEYVSELINICRSSCMMLDTVISNTMVGWCRLTSC